MQPEVAAILPKCSTCSCNLGLFFISTFQIFAPTCSVIGDAVAFRTLILLAAQPTAVTAVIAMKLFGLNLHLSVAAFVLSTAVYLSLVFPTIFLW